MMERMAGLSTKRIESLDVIRGVAVMGILLVNLPSFALLKAAYVSPFAGGGTTPVDLGAWLASYIFVAGKFRGLFSFLFGASILLIIDRSASRVAAAHYRRMAVLFMIGCAHLYLLWYGDILAHYALVGAIAYPFTRMKVRWLLATAIVLILVEAMVVGALWQHAVAAAARDTPEKLAAWTDLSQSFGVPTADQQRAEYAAFGGNWTGSVAWRWQHASNPFSFLFIGGAETLAFMLLGMAALRSGFLTGSWRRITYRRIVLVTIPIGWGTYALLGIGVLRSGFAIPEILFAWYVATAPVRPFLFAGYAAAVILLSSPGSFWTERIAAVGRAAFTNYIGTSVLMCAIFAGWGLDQFGNWSRAELYLLAPVTWAIMLAWSQPWLARYRYGPLEWLWRSLARGKLQPMVKAALPSRG